MTSAFQVTVSAKPAPISIDPRQTAVIVVDMQNHFVSPGGTFANSGVDTEPILAVVKPILRVLDAARGAGSKVIYLRMRTPDRPVPAGEPLMVDSRAGGRLDRWTHYVDLVGTKPPASGAGFNPPGASSTWNADIIDELAPQAGDIVVPKHRFSGFYETELDSILKSQGIRNPIFTGCTTSVCVESTLRDAAFRDYACMMLADCLAEPIGAGFDRTNHDATLLLTELLFGWVSDSAALVEAMAPLLVAAPISKD